MEKRKPSFGGAIFIILVTLAIVPRLIDILSSIFYIPSFSYLLYSIQTFFYYTVVKNPISMVLLVAVATFGVLFICQKLEHEKLERETDFLQAEHLCKSGDESMQGYADAAEIRLQKQNKLSAERYGKRAPQSIYNKR